MLNFTIIPVTPLMQNATLLWDSASKDAVLTDVGGDVEYLLSVVDEHRLNLRKVWLTHAHVDHVSGVPELRTRRNVPILGPQQEDAFWLEELPRIAQAYGLPPTETFTPDRWLNEGDVLQVGQYAFDVLHVPGHTPGSVVFYCAAENLLIAGDVLFLESVGRTDFPRGNQEELFRNIREKLFTLPDLTRVVTGHGAMTTIGHEKRHNPFVRL
ncbi:MAG: MBL fold metallo-hydrolase [Neisseria sp.]|nr:MBL fold metallo-hydrolase [Neisseria sp.]